MKWGELDERRVYEDMSIPEEMNFKTIFCAKMKEKIIYNLCHIIGSFDVTIALYF